MKPEQFKTPIEDVTVYGNPEGLNYNKAKKYSDVILTWEIIFELKLDCLKSIHITSKSIKLDCEVYLIGHEPMGYHNLEIDLIDWTEKHMNAPFVDGQIKPQSIVIDYRTNKIEVTF